MTRLVAHTIKDCTYKCISSTCSVHKFWRGYGLCCAQKQSPINCADTICRQSHNWLRMTRGMVLAPNKIFSLQGSYTINFPPKENNKNIDSYRKDNCAVSIILKSRKFYKRKKWIKQELKVSWIIRTPSLFSSKLWMFFQLDEELSRGIGNQ